MALSPSGGWGWTGKEATKRCGAAARAAMGKGSLWKDKRTGIVGRAPVEIVIQSNTELVGEAVADRIVSLVNYTPDAVIGLATGSTPLPVYQALRKRYEAGEVSFASVQTFNLDEYAGLPTDHPESYRSVIRAELTDHLDIPPASVHTPDGNAADLDRAAWEYEAAIHAAGEVDIQLLGIGQNGHIGFNEPGCSLASRTRVEHLTASTRAANARFFDGDISAVPERSITQGLGTIMDARHVILLAFGEQKADAVAQLVEGAVSARWPATILQHHPHVTVIVDEAAAAKLTLLDYYREAYGHTPSWRSI